jgi:hypothetical protein
MSYPERLAAGRCQENARRMVTLHPELRYVEGDLVFARPPGFEPFRLEHAWNVTPDGVIIDATGWAYDGLQPFQYQERRPPAF